MAHTGIKCNCCLFPPSGKHKHRGGSALLGTAHSEQRGEYGDRPRPWFPRPVWIH